VRRVVTVVCLVWVFSSVAVRFGQPVGPKDSAAVVLTTVHAQPADDPWGFEEAEEDTWRDVIRPQIADVGFTAAFLAFAMASFFRKSVRLKYITFVLAIAYMGFYKSNLISVVNIFGVMDWNLPIAKHNAMWYVFAIFTVASTILWGRLYCGRICAYGALTQLMDATLPKKLRVEPPAWLEQRAAWIKYGLLAAVIGYYLATHNLMVYRYVEPFWLFARTSSGSTPTETTLLWTGLGLLLLATVFVRNLYCRFLCPVGAMLGILSNLTVFKIKRWSECKTCKICEKTCEWGAIQGPKIVKSECVRCDDCERLYMDQKKCPHWIIILRKADKAASRPAAVSPATPM
jgi:NosR/NirI family transcriptional regulator, nitrous oxide reductase regulator